MKGIRGKLLLSAILIILINAFGTIGYMVMEGWNFRDSLFMTVITLTTVGYAEVHELSPTGEYFTIVLLIGGVGIILYVLATEARVIFEGELQDVFGRRRLEKKIKGLKDHYIICGYGRMGRIVARELKAKGVEAVVIEKEPVSRVDNGDILLFEGDATNEEVLKNVGIDKAKGLVSVLPTDAENLYVVLSGRGLNPKLFVLARASDEGAEQKMLRAGATRVVSPYLTGGLKIAHTILKPAVMGFIEFATRAGNIEIQMEEVPVQNDSKLVGITLDESGIGRDLGVIVVAIKNKERVMQFNPTSKTIMQEGDTLTALGEVSKLSELEEMAGT
ncbi:MAG TPA: potassium channel protein [Thermodesulfobacteriota bacterium]